MTGQQFVGTWGRSANRVLDRSAAGFDPERKEEGRSATAVFGHVGVCYPFQAFLNLKLIADSEGATLQDCVRITVYVSDLHRFAPLVSKVQAELWGKPPYPPRTMFEVQRSA